MNSEDKDIQGMFDLQLDLPNIDDLFPSSYEEALAYDDVQLEFDVHGPFCCMRIYLSS